MKPIATLHTCYPEKFGVPRQSGLVPAAWGRVEFVPEYQREEAVRGIEAFSHLWLITQFHLIDEAESSKVLTVRPPRLGGNERRGVFATRSPFRPNRLGLSVVKLERVETDGPRLWVSGVDLVDGTPIFDIKPYVPYADALPEATSAFAQEAPLRVKVRWQREVNVPDDVRAVIEQSISLQPQPAYQEASDRIYNADMAGWQVRWQMDSGEAVIIECAPQTAP